MGGIIALISQSVNPLSGVVTATYSCSCGSNITVTMGNINECAAEAQLECDDQCNSTPVDGDPGDDRGDDGDDGG